MTFTLPKTRGLFKKRRRRPSFDFDFPRTEVVDVRDPREVAWTRALHGNRTLAKKMTTLSESLPDASLPELVTHDWLDSRNIDFIFQAHALGGRWIAGGAMPDFVLQYSRNKGMVWNVFGDYWHNRPEVKSRDAAQRLAIVGSYVSGVLIHNYVALWENDILSPTRNDVFFAALSGWEY